MAIFIKIPNNRACQIVKWKVKVGTRVSRNSVLAIYKIDTSESLEKLKMSTVDNVGTVKKLLVKEGDTVDEG